MLASALRGGRQLTRGAAAAELSACRASGRRASCCPAADARGARWSDLQRTASRQGIHVRPARRAGAQEPALTRDEALAELARRYFTSRGPATLQDFVWWSGLTTADARAGIEMAGSDLSRHVIDGSVCWLPSSRRAVRRPAGAAHLLPVYDEYLVAYKDRSAVVDSRHCKPGTNAAVRFDDCCEWTRRWDLEVHTERTRDPRNPHRLRATHRPRAASRRRRRSPIRRISRPAVRVAIPSRSR